MSHEAVDVADKLAHAAEATAADRLLGDQSQPAFHLIKPASVSGRGVNVEARMARKPGLDPGLFVGGVVVGDILPRQPSRVPVRCDRTRRGWVGTHLNSLATRTAKECLRYAPGCQTRQRAVRLQVRFEHQL